MLPLGCEKGDGTRHPAPGRARTVMPAVTSPRPGPQPHTETQQRLQGGSASSPCLLAPLPSSLATCLYGPCQTSAQPRPSSKPIRPQARTLGHPDASRLPSRGGRARKALGVSAAEQELPVYRTRLIIPGMTMLNMGSSFRNPHRTQPPFTWDKFFPARQPWTKVCRGNAGGWGWGAFSEWVSLGCLCTDRTGRDRTAGTCSSRGCRPLTPLIRRPQARRASGDTWTERHALLRAQLPERMGAACPWPHR